MALFDMKSMLAAAGINVAEYEVKFREMQEVLAAGYAAFVDMQGRVVELQESNKRLESAVLVLLQDAHTRRAEESVERVARELAVDAGDGRISLDVRKARVHHHEGDMWERTDVKQLPPYTAPSDDEIKAQPHAVLGVIPNGSAREEGTV